MFGTGGPLSMGGGAAVGAANKEKIADVKAWIREVGADRGGNIFFFLFGGT